MTYVTLKWGVRYVGRIGMSKIAAFHSKLPGTSVYHNDNACTEGDNIESYNRVSGTGGLPLCTHCARL